MKILIAEDDNNFGIILKTELEEDGYTIDLATDGVKAVMNFIENNNTYGFVLLDIKMSGLDGINALRIIKKINPHIPAITFSGNAGTGEMADSVKAGAIRCLTKPFEISQLKEEIKNYSNRHKGVNS
jgi:DNA-binding response OmpR family regulator